MLQGGLSSGVNWPYEWGFQGLSALHGVLVHSILDTMRRLQIALLIGTFVLLERTYGVEFLKRPNDGESSCFCKVKHWVLTFLDLASWVAVAFSLTLTSDSESDQCHWSDWGVSEWLWVLSHWLSHWEGDSPSESDSDWGEDHSSDQ